MSSSYSAARSPVDSSRKVAEPLVELGALLLGQPLVCRVAHEDVPEAVGLRPAQRLGVAEDDLLAEEGLERAGDCPLLLLG